MTDTQPLAQRIADAVAHFNQQWDNPLSHTGISTLVTVVLAEVRLDLDTVRRGAVADARNRVANLPQVPGEDMIGATRSQILAAIGGVR